MMEAKDKDGNRILDLAYDKAKDSNGSAMREQEAYMKSLAGTINKLKENLAGMWTQIIKGSSMTNVINSINLIVTGLRSMVSAVGALPTVISLASGALFAFNKEMRTSIKNAPLLKPIMTAFDSFVENKVGENSKRAINKRNLDNQYIAKLRLLNGDAKGLGVTFKNLFRMIETDSVKATGSFVAGLIKIKAGAIASTVAINALKIAVSLFEGVLTMGLSLGVSFLFTKISDGISHLINKTKEAHELTEQTAQDVGKLSENINKSNTSYNKIKQYQQELANTSSMEKRIDLQKKLNEEQEKMAQLLPQSASGYDKEGKLISQNNSLIEQQISLQKQQIKNEVSEMAKKNDYVRDLKEYKQYMEEAKKAQDIIKNSDWKQPQAELQNGGTLDQWRDRATKATQSANKFSESLNNLSKIINTLRADGKTDQQLMDMGISKGALDAVKEYNDLLVKQQQESEKASDGTKDLKDSTESYAQVLDQVKQDIKDLTSEFEKFSSRADIAQEAIEEIQKYGGVTKDTLDKIFQTKDPKLISALADSSTAVQNLTQCVQDDTQAQYDREQQIIQASVVQRQMEEQGANATVQATNAKGQAYQADNANNNALLQSKAQNDGRYANGVVNSTNNMVNAQGQAYQQDNKNFNDLLNKKIESAHGFAKIIYSIMSAVNDATSSATQGKMVKEKIPDGGLPLKTLNLKPIRIIDPKQVKMIDHTRSEMENFDKAREKANKKAEREAKKRHKENKVDIKDINVKIDGYKTLDRTLSNVNAELDRYDKLTNQGSLNSRNDKLREEVGLLNKKKQAILDLISSYEHERNTLAGMLRSNGFNLDDNNIYNYFNKLRQMEDKVNDMANSNKAKQGAIDHFNTVKEQADRYMELIDKIKSSQNSLLDIDEKVKKTEDTLGEDPLEDLKLDRYKVLDDHLQDINNELERYKALQDNGSYDEQNKYLEKQIDLYNRKKQAIEDIIKASQEEAIEIQNKLNTYGLNAYNGNIDNYESRMAELKRQIYNDSDPEQAEKQWKKLQDLADQYWDLTSSKIPDLNNQILDIDKSIREANDTKLKDPLQDVKIDKYKELENALTSINNELDYTKALESQANGTDKLIYMNKEIDLYNKQKEAIENLVKAKETELEKTQDSLVKQGFNFDENGNITNYVERLEELKDQMYNATDKDKAKDDFDKLNNALEKYFDLSNSSLPDLKKQWLDVNANIKELRNNYVSMMGDTEREVTNIIKDQLDKRKKAMEDETNAIKENIQKQKEAYDEAYNDKDYKSQLSQKQDDLNKIQAQIDEASRNNSLEGQAMLQDLLNQKKQIQDELNKMIESHEHEQGDKAFDDESNDLDKKLKDQEEALDKKYSAEKIAEMVKSLIQTGSVELEGQVIKLNDAIKEYYKEQGDVYADSSKKMQDFIDKLELTKKLYADLITMNRELGVSDSNMLDNYRSPNPTVLTTQSANLIAKSITPSISVTSPLHIENMNGGNPEELKAILEENNNKVIREIKNSLYSH